ncbi:hypothetical protein NIES4072_51980 [Nostoc commune NIES-4072]|uniref:Uncharacterized protein n=1 Tax=Nostoc commune NIES-4072 TaxID=2005467 RepID=A0A2R5FRX1_NOSCO|nr:hypothetical protein NIES4070_38970 [Nostoc commune HK-02]GBG21512.1 hypothetical protein NIES4072_51980 [Nostoc commune NIES-4072]
MKNGSCDLASDYTPQLGYASAKLGLTNFGGLSPQQDRQHVLCRGLNPRHKT